MHPQMENKLNTLIALGLIIMVTLIVAFIVIYAGVVSAKDHASEESRLYDRIDCIIDHPNRPGGQAAGR